MATNEINNLNPSSTIYENHLLKPSLWRKVLRVALMFFINCWTGFCYALHFSLKTSIDSELKTYLEEEQRNKAARVAAKALSKKSTQLDNLEDGFEEIATTLETPEASSTTTTEEWKNYVPTLLRLKEPNKQLSDLDITIIFQKLNPISLTGSLTGLAFINPGNIVLNNVKDLPTNPAETKTAKPLAVPVIIKGVINHTVVFVVDFQNNRLEYYNSKGLTIRDDETSELICSFNTEDPLTLGKLTEHLLTIYNLKQVIENTQCHQTDFNNCGIFVLDYLNQRTKQWSAEDIQKAPLKDPIGKRKEFFDYLL